MARRQHNRAAQDAAVGRKIPDRASKSVTSGAFHLVKISGISGSAVKGTRFVGSSHWNIPRNSGKSKKVGPFSRLEFPNGMSCSIYVSCSLYQFQVHGRTPRRAALYDQMEQLFTNRKFHFCSNRNFRLFFLYGKRPSCNVDSPETKWCDSFSQSKSRKLYLEHMCTFLRGTWTWMWYAFIVYSPKSGPGSQGK